MIRKLSFGRYDYAAFSSLATYSMCSFVIPLVIVEMANDLVFPLTGGGMSAGGGLHMIRSCAMVTTLLLCGMLAGRIGKRRSMAIAMLLSGGGIFLCAFSHSYALLIPFLLFAGLGEGICEGIATPFVQDLHNDTPERYVAITHSMWSVGTVFAVLLSGLLLTAGISWRIILLATGTCTLGSALLFLWKENPQKKYPENPQKENLSDILHYTKEIAVSPLFWLYSFLMFLGSGAEFCFSFWCAAFLRISWQVNAMIASLGTAAIAFGMFTGRFLSGCFSTKDNMRKQLFLAVFLMLPPALLLVFLKPGMIPSQTAAIILVLLLLYLCGVCIGPFWPLLQVYAVTRLKELDSTMLYIYFSAIGVPGCGFFAWFMGFLGDRVGLHGAFLMVPVLLFLYVITLILEVRITHRQELK